jgi:DNA-directed RNA polymerase subunit RPC12/RpoP
MIDFNSGEVTCDLKAFCFKCTAKPIFENNSDAGKMFYHCSSCGKDILCNMAIGRQFDKRTNTVKEICPKCRGKLKQFHYPLNETELEELRI